MGAPNLRQYLPQFSLLLIVACSGCTEDAPATSGHVDNQESLSSNAERDSSNGSEAEQPATRPPLTDDDIRAFVILAKAFPNQQIPDYQAGYSPRFSRERPVGEIVSQLQSHFRYVASPERQASYWSEDPEISEVLRSHRITESQFSDLVWRISMAVAAREARGRMDFSEIEAQARENVRSVAQRIEEQRENPEYVDSIELLLDGLQESVALYEYCKMMQNVPEADIDLIDRRRSSVSPLLPEMVLFGSPLVPLETNDEVLPVGYEELSPGRQFRSAQ